MSQTGQPQKHQDQKEPNEAQQAKNFEVFNEKEAAKESAEAREVASKNFLGSQTYENLSNNIPDKIEVGDMDAPLTTNVVLLDRIVTNVTNLSTSKIAYENALATYGKDIGIDQSITYIGKGKDLLIQKLAIAISCNDGTIIHLNTADREKLTHLLLPLVSESEVHLSQDERIETNDFENSFLEHPAYPLLRRLVEEGHINEEDFQVIQAYYIKNKSFEGMDLTEHSELVKSYLTLLTQDGEELKKSHIEQFFKDFPEGEQEEMNYRPALALIAENYISIPDTQGNKHIDRDYYTAVEIAAKKVLTGAKNIDRSSVKFEKSIKYIETGNREERYTGLKMLLELKGEYEGKLAVERQKQDDAITKLLKKNHENGLKGIEIKKQNMENARILEQQDRAAAANDPSHQTAEVKTIKTRDTPLASGDRDLETTRSHSEEKAA